MVRLRVGIVCSFVFLGTFAINTVVVANGMSYTPLAGDHCEGWRAVVGLGRTSSQLHERA